MTILSTHERKCETKTFNENFAKKVRTCRLPFPETRSLNSLMAGPVGPEFLCLYINGKIWSMLLKYLARMDLILIFNFPVR
jgi:hypothetical protein